MLEARLVLGNLANAAGNHDAAEEILRAGLAELRPMRQPKLLAVGLAYLSAAQFLKGRFQPALETDRERREVARRLGSSQRTRGLEAWVWLHLGDYARSAALAEKLRPAMQELRLVPKVRQLLAALALVRGDAACARDLLLSQPNNGTVQYPEFQTILGLAAAMEGETAAAWEIASGALREAITRRSQRQGAIALAGIAYLDIARGQPSEGVTHYALAQQDPFVARSRWFADVVGARVETAAADLDPAEVAAARERGATGDMWAAAEALVG
jgi:hypothetical protein